MIESARGWRIPVLPAAYFTYHAGGGDLKPFDERLFTLKLREPSRWMQNETVSRRRQVDSDQRKLGQAFGTGWLAKRVSSDVSVLREYLSKVDKVCRETWLSDHETIAPDFIRRELLPHLLTQIAARKGAIRGDLSLLARRTGVRGAHLTPALHHLVQEINHLQDEIATRYEIEAVELVKRSLRPAPLIASVPVVTSAPPTGEPRSRGPKSEADNWQDFHDKYQALANEEHAISQRESKDRTLRAYCTYGKHAEIFAERGKPEQGPFCLLQMPECGLWWLDGGPNEHFEAKFRALATRTGCALGAPQGTSPEDFWLHRLFLDLLEHRSDHLFSAKKDKGGMILHVCAASATFCSRLERRALEASMSLNRRNSKRRKPERGDPEVAKRRSLVRSNPNIPTSELCVIFDREGVPVPFKWQEAGLNQWAKAYKRPGYRSRIDVLVSKDRPTA